MAGEKLLPLFPLELVLFPNAELPLRIFEPRYREMVGRAVAENSEFGIVLQHEGKLGATGCTAMVEKVTRKYDDGRFDIITRGWRRFHLGELDDSKEYLQAQVEFFDDDAQPAVDPALVQRAVELSASLAKVTGLEAPPKPPTEEPYPSYVLSNSLPLHVKFKQQILMSRSETERLTRFIDHIEEMVPRLEATKRARKLARTNGHPH